MQARTFRPTHQIFRAAATGSSREEAEKNMYEAIRLHIEGLNEDGLPIPASSAVAEYVVVSS